MIKTKKQFIDQALKPIIKLFGGSLLFLVLIAGQVNTYEAFEAHVANVTALLVSPCEEGYLVSGYKFYDRNANGQRDEGEEGLPGWWIILEKGPYEPQFDYDNSGYVSWEDLAILEEVIIGAACPAGKNCDFNNDTVIDTYDSVDMQADIISREVEHKLTNGEGYFSFTGLESKPYIIREVAEDGWLSVSPNVKYIGPLECGGTTVNFANTLEGGPSCGDGFLDPGEQCDDGNLIDNDGCSSTCELPQCNALSIGYWQNHGGCENNPAASAWTADINALSFNNLQGAFATITGEEICTTLAPKNCPPGGQIAGQLCRAKGKALADLTNIVSGHLDLNALIAGADDGSDAFDHLGLSPASTVGQALNIIESIILDPNHTKAQLADAAYVGERIYAFYEDENPLFPACIYPFCGNGIIDAGEQCDGEAGVTEGYVCTAGCVLEEIIIEPFCGDGIINQEAEQCDGTDGITEGFTCTAGCVLEPIEPISLPLTQIFCGDGIVNQAAEQCDGTDGVGDGQICNSGCLLEIAPFCGDGIANQESEQCDGSASEGYICTAGCVLEEIIPKPYCGDGIINQESEQCDGQNGLNEGFVCNAECILEEVIIEPQITESTTTTEPLTE